MSAKQKTQRTFLTVTMMTVLAVTTVFIVYAVILGTYYGGNVSISQIQGTFYYNNPDAGSTWSTTLSAGNGTAWYARLNVTNTPSQTVNVAWTLEKYNTTSSTWDTVSGPSPPTTTITLTAGVNTAIYVTSNGQSTGNYNWGQFTTTSGDYRVKAVMSEP